MKKIITLILSAALVASTLVGCGSKQAASTNTGTSSNTNNTNTSTTDSSSKKKIGVVVKALDSEHWLTVKKGAETAAKEENVDITVLAPDKESNVEQQFRIIEDLIQQKVSALAVAPCDSTGIVPIIQKANAAKIPVITVDTNADADVISFVGTDNAMGGKMAGERIVKILNGKGKVALITGVPGQQTHRDRISGFKDAIKGSPDIKLVAEQPANSESALAMTVMENVLESNPDLNAVFCTNALMALGAVEAIDAKGKSGQVKVIGFDSQTDALNMVKQGKIDSMIAQSPYNMGYQAIKNAVAYLNGKGATKRVDTGTELITKENVDKYIK